MEIYYLHYQRRLPDGTPVGMHVGTYSSLRKAEEAQARLKSERSYRDHPSGFSITCHRIDAEYDDPTFFQYWERTDPRPCVWLNQLVAAIVGAVSAVVASPANIELQSDSKGVWTRADPRQLGSIIGQLLVFALERAARGGHVDVDLDWVHLDESQSRERVQSIEAIPSGWHARLRIISNAIVMDDSIMRLRDVIQSHGWWLNVSDEGTERTVLKVFFPCEPKSG